MAQPATSAQEADKLSHNTDCVKSYISNKTQDRKSSHLKYMNQCYDLFWYNSVRRLFHGSKTASQGKKTDVLSSCRVLATTVIAPSINRHFPSILPRLQGILVFPQAPTSDWTVRPCRSTSRCSCAVMDSVGAGSSCLCIMYQLVLPTAVMNPDTLYHQHSDIPYQ